VRGCVGAWVRGCVGAWVRGCVGAWVRGCVGAWVRGAGVGRRDSQLGHAREARCSHPDGEGPRVTAQARPTKTVPAGARQARGRPTGRQRVGAFTRPTHQRTRPPPPPHAPCRARRRSTPPPAICSAPATRARARSRATPTRCRAPSAKRRALQPAGGGRAAAGQARGAWGRAGRSTLMGRGVHIGGARGRGRRRGKGYRECRWGRHRWTETGRRGASIPTAKRLGRKTRRCSFHVHAYLLRRLPPPAPRRRCPHARTCTACAGPSACSTTYPAVMRPSPR
jgi:hypothetical protein